MEGDVAKQGARGLVAEVNLPEVEVARAVHKLDRIGGVRLLARGIEQRKDPSRGGKGGLQLRHHTGDLVEGLHVLVRVAEEALHLAYRERRRLARHHAQAAHDGNHGIDDVVDDAGRGVG